MTEAKLIPVVPSSIILAYFTTWYFFAGGRGPQLAMSFAEEMIELFNVDLLSRHVFLVIIVHAFPSQIVPKLLSRKIR